MNQTAELKTKQTPLLEKKEFQTDSQNRDLNLQLVHTVHFLIFRPLILITPVLKSSYLFYQSPFISHVAID